MKIDDFEELCLTNAHLAFRPKGFSRRFAPQNDNGYPLTLLHRCIFPHLRITTLPLMTITTIPYYHVRNRDADEQRLASDKRWKGPRPDGFLSLSLFISLLNEASTVQEPLNIGQAVAFLAADG